MSGISKAEWSAIMLKADMTTADRQTWKTLVDAMAQEGCAWCLTLDYGDPYKGVSTGSAWRIDHPNDDPVETLALVPTEALESLLQRCRRRWPKNDALREHQ